MSHQGEVLGAYGPEEKCVFHAVRTRRFEFAIISEHRGNTSAATDERRRKTAAAAAAAAFTHIGAGKICVFYTGYVCVSVAVGPTETAANRYLLRYPTGGLGKSVRGE